MSTLGKARFLTDEKRLLIALRLVVALVVVAFFFSRPAHFKTPWQFWYTLVVFILSNAAFVFEKLKAIRTRRVHFLVFAFDLAMISVLVIFLGQRSREFYVVFFMTIFVAAAGKSMRYAFAISAVMSALYWFLALRGVADVESFSGAFLTQVVFFFVVSMFVGYLSEEAEARRRRAEQLADKVRNAEGARDAAEAAGVAKEERLKVMFEHAPDAYFLCDSEGVFVDGNRAAEGLTGYKSEELVGKDSRNLDLLPAQDVPRAAELLAKNARGLPTGPDEFSLIRKDGTRAAVETRTFPVRMGGESLVLAIARDITESKRAEEALRVTEEQLRQSQKLEAVGRLAGGVAHDFNNMLGAIIGYSDVVMTALNEGDPLRKDVEHIKNAADRAAALTDQLLAFSRKQTLQPRIMDLNAAVRGLERMLRRLIGEDVEFATVLANDLGHVKADPGQIDQVLMNLAVNARDAMPRGGRLTIETANVDLDEGYASTHVDTRPGPHVMLAVADTGCGMDQETRSHIFEPFFTTKQKGKGTGLGLAMVYGIVKQNGGNIGVYSEIGEGTTFKVYLPRVEGAVEPVQRRKPTGIQTRGSETVLVVEDEEVLRRLVCRILAMAGYVVLEARSGEEALLRCEERQGPIHLMVTDVVMPRMSGCKLTERVAVMRPETKVAYMSGYTDDAIVRSGTLDADMPFIQKPFTASNLLAKVREALGPPEASRQ
jgi:PAS domain S-box-containing protein